MNYIKLPLLFFFIILFVSCSDDSTVSPANNSNTFLTHSLARMIPGGNTIDGGYIIAKMNKNQGQANIEVSNSFTSEAGFFCSNWRNNVKVKLDNIAVNSPSQNMAADPYSVHKLVIEANSQLMVPAISKDIPAICPVELKSPVVNEVKNKTFNITWDKPPKDATTTAAIVISFANKPDLPPINTITADDNGSFTITPSDFIDIPQELLDINISVVRFCYNIDKFDGKNYLFANSFTNTAKIKLDNRVK